MSKFTGKGLTVKEVKEILSQLEDWETVQFLTCNALYSHVYCIKTRAFGPVFEPRMLENPNVWGIEENVVMV